MIILLLSAIILTDGGRALIEEDDCDHDDLQICMNLVSDTHIGIPKNTEELEEYCIAHYRSMECINAWSQRCLTAEALMMLYGHTAEMEGKMRFLCTKNTAIRKEFLNEPNCWGWLLPAWPRCVEVMQVTISEKIEPRIEQAEDLPYFDKDGEICRAHDDFLKCVSDAGHLCSSSGMALVHRMACALAENSAPCVHQPRAYCDASTIPIISLLHTALYSIIFYLTRL